MSVLCRKNELGKALNNLHNKFPEEYSFYPKTWVLPRDLRALECYLMEMNGNSRVKSTSMSAI